jgi:pyruvate/2-oxoglutarate/acetoin dehydrogenase E1 component
VICDIGWRTGGIGAEIAAQIMEECWSDLKAPVARVALPDVPAPAARTMEAAYYPGTSQIIAAARAVLERA